MSEYVYLYEFLDELTIGTIELLIGLFLSMAMLGLFSKSVRYDGT